MCVSVLNGNNWTYVINFEKERWICIYPMKIVLVGGSVPWCLDRFGWLVWLIDRLNKFCIWKFGWFIGSICKLIFCFGCLRKPALTVALCWKVQDFLCAEKILISSYVSNLRSILFLKVFMLYIYVLLIDFKSKSLVKLHTIDSSTR